MEHPRSPTGQERPWRQPIAPAAAEQGNGSPEARGTGRAAPAEVAHEEALPDHLPSSSRRAESAPDMQRRSSLNEATPRRDSHGRAAGGESVQASAGNAVLLIHRCTQTGDEPEPARTPLAALPQPHQPRQPANPTPTLKAPHRKPQSPALTSSPRGPVSKPAARAALRVSPCKPAPAQAPSLPRRLPMPARRKPGHARDEQPSCAGPGISVAAVVGRATAPGALPASCGTAAQQSQRRRPGTGGNLDGLAEGLVRTLPGELSASGCSSPERPAKPHLTHRRAGRGVAEGAQRSAAAAAQGQGAAAGAERRASPGLGAVTTGSGLLGALDASCLIELSPMQRLPNAQPQPVKELANSALTVPTLPQQATAHAGAGLPGQHEPQKDAHMQPDHNAGQARNREVREAPVSLSPSEVAGRAGCLNRLWSSDGGQPPLSFAQAAADLEALCAAPLLEAAGVTERAYGSQVRHLSARSVAGPPVGEAGGSEAADLALGAPRSPGSSAVAEFDLARAEADLAALLEEAGGGSHFYCDGAALTGGFDSDGGAASGPEGAGSGGEQRALPNHGRSSSAWDASEDARVHLLEGVLQEEGLAQELCTPWMTGWAPALLVSIPVRCCARGVWLLTTSTCAAVAHEV